MNEPSSACCASTTCDTLGSNAINRANLVQVQAWMGHADHRTTMRYLHHKSLDAEADLLAEQLLLSATRDEET